MSGHTVLAFDFGASSGRAIVAVLENGALSCREVHRFENNPVEKNGTLYWDVETLFQEVRTGIEKAGAFESIGFDTWGVDFGLLDEDGVLLEPPVHYRDRRTDGMVEKVFQTLSEDTLYQSTGNQIMKINTLFQLMALKEQNPQLLARAKTLLFMPDLFAFQLTGKPCCEMSIASTSQMFDPLHKRWSTETLRALDLPEQLLLPVVPTGTVSGSFQRAKVIAVAGHDTQCAVAALPTKERDVAFLSCGTWSLLGTELDAPVLTEQSRRLALSNEIGVDGKINYLKNIIGLWLIQESRRAWRRQGQEYSYADLEREALAAEPFFCFIDPDSPEFGIPGDIPQRVRAFCEKTGQQVPKTTGQTMRCIYESLALKYRFALEQLGAATGKTFRALHVLGGGTKDTLLCQMASSSCGIPVVAGPIEATALGNILIQLVALGALENISEGRALLAKTEPLKRYNPREEDAWNQAYERYVNILK